MTSLLRGFATFWAMWNGLLWQADIFTIEEFKNALALMIIVWVIAFMIDITDNRRLK